MLVRESLELVLADYKVNGKRSIDDAERRIRKHLLRLLPESLELSGLSSPLLLIYARQRIDEGATAASVNREVAFLRRACTLAGSPWVTGWRKLRESAPRQGFFSNEELTAVLSFLPPAECAAITFLSLTGWRKGEAFGLKWTEVDFGRGEVRLLAGTTKTGEGRLFPLYPQLRSLLEQQEERKNGPYVFHRNGRPIRWVYNAWRTACRKAGVPGKLMHDFRRTAARNLIEAGVDKQIAMKLLGHKTPSIFDRYRITDDRDLRTAADALGRHLRR